jgi:hypothetical protein
MKLKTLGGATASLTALIAAVAVASPLNTGALDVPANRIVGLWSTEGLVGPCGFPPMGPVRNTLLFHAGGTVVENPRFPPAGAQNAFGVPGINQRGQALGTWSYDPATKRYAMHLQFDWYVNDAYHGYMTVDRDIQLSSDAMVASGPVWAARFDAAGNLIAQVCGEAVSSRL